MKCGGTVDAELRQVGVNVTVDAGVWEECQNRERLIDQIDLCIGHHCEELMVLPWGNKKMDVRRCLDGDDEAEPYYHIHAHIDTIPKVALQRN